ncbi:alpha/beta fold hydrolase [Microcoleus sp. LEGE 07076]|uniref:alpha/beta hydrolase n=1 Tax=Microcoleus sp. LEGE 07076 TaxID=915322 RepID=UPI00187EC92E|nr:alpha/beta fold hydrolase [Microcoleus sp. LEGE 07076]MBE9185818.1 alpha/beta fold hydrolase [Microcoleus sp. LEGE 07076]
MNKLRLFFLSKSLITFGIVLAIAYSAACLFLLAAQAKFIFFPARAIETTPDDWQLKYQDVWLPIMSTTGAVESVHGWWIPQGENSGAVPGDVSEAVAVPVAPTNKGRLGRVVLYLHGNGSNVGANLEQANRFHRLGVSVFAIDYRGYGKSQGDFPSESRVYEDAKLAWDYLVKQRGIHPNQIYIYGHSLGGAIAIDLAVRHPEAAGLIVEGSFTSVRAMVDFQKGLFWMFPIDFLLRQRFDSLAKVDRLQMPVLFIHGTADTVVPAQMSKKLFDAAPEPKQLYMVPDGSHNNAAQIGGAEYLHRLRQFLDISK